MRGSNLAVKIGQINIRDRLLKCRSGGRLHRCYNVNTYLGSELDEEGSEHLLGNLLLVLNRSSPLTFVVIGERKNSQKFSCERAAKYNYVIQSFLITRLQKEVRLIRHSLNCFIE
jgi:hypothetical protein